MLTAKESGLSNLDTDKLTNSLLKTKSFKAGYVSGILPEYQNWFWARNFLLNLTATM